MVEMKEFSNGFKVNILNNDNGLIKFSLNIGAGFKYENIDNNGISHYLEHVLILKRLQTIYSYLIDFTTTYNSINLFFQCKKEDLKNLINELFDLFSYKEFDEEHIKFVEEEKTIIKNDINLYHDQICSSSQWIFMNKKLFPNNSRGLNYLGSIKNVDKMNHNDLLKWKNKYFVSNNANLNFIGNIDIDFVEKLLKDNFLTLKQSKLNFDLENINNNCESIIKCNLNGKYFYYAFDLNNISIETQLTGLFLMNEISNEVRDKIRNQKRDGYFNFADINWNLGYLYLHLGSFSMSNNNLVKIFKELLKSESFKIDKEKFEQIKSNLKGYFDYLSENQLLINMGNISFDENSLNIFELENKLEEFSYNDFKNNLEIFFKLKQDYIIIE